MTHYYQHLLFLKRFPSENDSVNANVSAMLLRKGLKETGDRFTIQKSIWIFLLKTVIIFNISVFCTTNRVCAYYFEFEPSFVWELYYEDNVSGSQTEQKHDFSNRYKPELEFSLNFAKISLSGHSELNIIEYTKEKDWNSVDQNYSVDCTFRLNPRSELRLSGSYRVDTNPERHFQEGDDGVIVERFKNKRKNYQANYLYRLSHNSFLTLSFLFSNYKTRISSGTNFYVFRANYNHNLSRKNTLLFDIGYSTTTYKFEIGGDTLDYQIDTYDANIGFHREFGDEFTGEIKAGWRYTRSESNQAIYEKDPETGDIVLVGFEPSTGSATGSNFSFLLEKGFTYTWLRLKVDQNFGTNADTGESFQRRNILIEASYDFTRRLTGKFSWSFYHHDAMAGEYNNRYRIDRDSFRISTRLTYYYSKRLMVTLGFSRTTSKNSYSSTENERNNFFLQCNFLCTRPFIFR